MTAVDLEVVHQEIASQRVELEQPQRIIDFFHADVPLALSELLGARAPNPLPPPTGELVASFRASSGAGSVGEQPSLLEFPGPLI